MRKRTNFSCAIRPESRKGTFRTRIIRRMRTRCWLACHGLQPRLTRGLRRHALRDARRRHFCPARRKRNATPDIPPAPCSAGIEVIQRPVNGRVDLGHHQLRGRLLQVTSSFYGKFGPRAPSNSHAKKSASCSLRSLQSNGSPGISSMSAVSSCPGRASHLSRAPSAR